MAQTPEQRKQYFRDYFKKRQARNKELGICVSCTNSPAVNGKTCCQRCLEDKKLANKFGSAGPYRQLYSDLFERQGGKCGICRTTMLRPVLDHNHKTMEVRGLLCSRCNVGLGQFMDSPELLNLAVTYVTRNAGIGISIIREESRNRRSKT